MKIKNLEHINIDLTAALNFLKSRDEIIRTLKTLCQRNKCPLLRMFVLELLETYKEKVYHCGSYSSLQEINFNDVSLMEAAFLVMPQAIGITIENFGYTDPITFMGLQKT